MRQLPAVTTALSLVLGLGVLAYDYASVGTMGLETAAPGTGSTPDARAPAAPATSPLPGMPLFGVVASATASTGIPLAPGATPAVDEASALPPSRASYTLFGIILTPGDATRLAIIGESDAEQRRYRQGDAAPDGAVVRTIRRTDVVLERHGQLEALPLRKDTMVDTGGEAPGLNAPALPGQEDVEPQSSAPPGPPPMASGGPDPLANLRRAIQARKAAAARGDGPPPMFEPPPQ